MTKIEPGFISHAGRHLDGLVATFLAMDEISVNGCAGSKPDRTHQETITAAISAVEDAILNTEAVTIPEAVLQIRIASGRLEIIRNPGYDGADIETQKILERAYSSAIGVMRKHTGGDRVADCGGSYYGDGQQPLSVA